ncbi:MAG: 4Fe-4S binding protein [Clostridiales bacterium]|jgi:Fe-S-cluster-containing hydrogenase component 2|nr:4Fe-4S binding protein [Clostridiales bacterium]
MKKFAINPNNCDKSPGCPVRRECPSHAILEMDGVYYIDMDVCRGCGLCVKVCPRNAVEESAS